VTHEELKQVIRESNHLRFKKYRRAALKRVLDEIGACRSGRRAAMKFNSHSEAWSGLDTGYLLWFVKRVTRRRLEAGDITPIEAARANSRADTIALIADILAGPRCRPEVYRKRMTAAIHYSFNQYGELK
jgi:hypothetical protein